MIKKTAIIIGASSEIGFDTAKRFASAGYNLALTYNSNEIDTSDFADDVQVKTYKLNLENGDIRNFFSQVEKDFKSVDCLIYCAGIAQRRAIIFDVTDEEIDKLFEVNIKSAIKCIREFTKITANKNPANIVLVGSFVEKNGCSCESVYTATKSAMSGLCRSLSTELGNLDIRINLVCPGFIDTKMNNNLDDEEKEEIASMTPLKRLGTVSDVSTAILFLSSSGASFITGQTLYVDGGLVLE